MKGTIFKRFIAIIVICLLLCASALLAGCNNDYIYRPFEVGNITGGYCKHNAFVGMCYWNGGEKVIEIPDEYKGLPVVYLGGHTGWLGTDNMFEIVLRDQEYSYIGDDYSGDDDYETLTFTIRIGKNLKAIECGGSDRSFGYRTYDENGEMHIDVLYKIVYYFEVDSENKDLYSIDGKLYQKYNNTLINF